MKITVKCPNCFKQVSKEDRYCVFCGYDLEGVAPAAGGADAAEAEAYFYDGPRYCPNGHDVSDPSLGFCPTCGSPLVDEPSAGTAVRSAPSPSPAPSPRLVVRKCGCGYVCDDAELTFCPNCGMPFDDGAPSGGGPDRSDWICACGTSNPYDMDYCIGCSNPRGWRHSRKEVPVEEEKPFIPDGMEPPTDSDLEVKNKYST